MSTARPMTADAFITMPEPRHGRPWNLVDGEVVVNSASFDHQAAAGAVAFALTLWTREAGNRGKAGAEIDIKLDERNVYAPDVWWYADGRVPARGTAAPYPMPDLAVEVGSPTTWRYDIGVKRAGYERHGLPELWLVDGESHTVEVFRRSRRDMAGFDIAIVLDRDGRLETPLLPGFSLAVGEVFDQ